MGIRFNEAVKVAGLGIALLVLAGPALGVDGVVEINHARALAGGVTSTDAAGYPVTLNHSGSYRLTGNLTVGNNDSTIIEITADDVTLDLNGFEISCRTLIGPCFAGSGTGISADRSNVTIVNGTVRSMGRDGIFAGNQARIEHVRAINNNRDGIFTRGGSTLIDNTASDNTSNGIVTGIGSTVSTNTTRGNGDTGITASTGCTVTGNTVSDNGTEGGIYCNGGCTISGNTVLSNQGAGIGMLGGNTITGNTIRNNGNFGLSIIGTDSGYSLNVLTGNKAGGNTAQVSGGTSLGQNFCGTDQVCP